MTNIKFQFIRHRSIQSLKAKINSNNSIWKWIHGDFSGDASCDDKRRKSCPFIYFVRTLTPIYGIFSEFLPRISIATLLSSRFFDRCYCCFFLSMLLVLCWLCSYMAEACRSVDACCTHKARKDTATLWIVLMHAPLNGHFQACNYTRTRKTTKRNHRERDKKQTYAHSCGEHTFFFPLANISSRIAGMLVLQHFVLVVFVFGSRLLASQRTYKIHYFIVRANEKKADTPLKHTHTHRHMRARRRILWILESTCAAGLAALFSHFGK